jgi:hypothetical protein
MHQPSHGMRRRTSGWTDGPSIKTLGNRKAQRFGQKYKCKDIFKTPGNTGRRGRSAKVGETAGKKKGGEVNAPSFFHSFFLSFFAALEKRSKETKQQSDWY